MENVLLIIPRDNMAAAELMTRHVIDFGIRSAIIRPDVDGISQQIRKEGQEKNMKPVIRKPGEDIDHLIRRFNRASKKAGIIKEVKRRRYYTEPSAMRRAKHRAAVALERQRGRQRTAAV